MREKKTKSRAKKIAICALSAALAFSVFASFVACETGGDRPGGTVSEQKETFTVTFASEGGTIYGTQTVEEGSKATLPAYTDRYGNAITQWYYQYPSGATEIWSFAGYPVTENMTLYAVESEGASGAVYELDASFSAYIDAMGGVEFGAGIYQSATITVLSAEEERYLLTMQVSKSSVTIYGVTCDTFIDPEATSSTADPSTSPVPLGSIGYYDADGEIVTDGVQYTLSEEGDTASAPDPEGGTDYVQARYVTEITMILENVGPLEELDELEITFYINSQVMGGQFCNDGASASMSAATLTISGMTETEQQPDAPASGISGAAIDENGHLILTLSDGSTLDAGLVKGDDGAAGVGISRIEYDAPTLHIYLTDGTHYAFDLQGDSDSDLPDNVTETSASCTQDGVRTTYTDATKTEVAGVRTIEKATGHTYEDGVCSVCGHEQADDMVFALNDAETGYILTEYNSHAWDTVSVPDTYNGLPVVAIADGETLFGAALSSGVFKDHTEIEAVMLGQNLTAVGIGAFSGCSQLSDIDLSRVTSIGGWAFQNAALTSVSLNAAVSSVPNNAFYGCAQLTSVSLPENLQEIGASAFYNCTNLTSVAIPDGITSIGNSAFMQSGLTSVVVPASVTSMGTSVFADCAGLASASIKADIALPGSTFIRCAALSRFNSEEDGVCDLTAYDEIPTSAFVSAQFETVLFSSSLTSVGTNAFSGCSALTAVDFNGNTGGVTFGNQAFQNCTALETIELPAGSALGGTMFSGCTSLKNIALPASVSEIPSNFLQDCESLESVSIPDSVTEIGTGAFSGCTSLTSIVFGENSQLQVLRGVTGCTALTSFTIPAGVTEIASCSGNYALIEIVNLSGLPVTAGGSDNGSIAQYAETVAAEKPDSAFVTVGDYTLYRDGAAENEKWAVTAYNGTPEDGALVLPESFTVNGTEVTNYSIAARVFYGSETISSVSIPAGVTSVGAFAFSNCENLVSVTFAEDSRLTSVGVSAFAGCEVLFAIALPDSVLSVGNSAFSGCTALSSVDFGEGVQTIGSSAFASCYALKTIVIPASVTSIQSNSFSSCALAEVYNLAGDGLANIPAAENVYTAEGGSKLVKTEDGFTFLYIPAAGETPAKAYLLSYSGDAAILTLPSSFTAGEESVTSYEIYAGAFAGRSFTSVTLPAAVTAVGDYAFYGVSVLRITFADPAACKSIGAYAFAYSSVMMFDSEAAYGLDLSGFASVGEYAFAYTTNLHTVKVAASVTDIAGRAFAYSAVTSLEFAEERTEELSLATYAFAYMTSLRNVTLPSYITVLPQYLFRGCTALTSVTLPDTLTTINNYVFRDCSALTQIVLPSSLTNVTSTAMSGSGIEYFYLDGSEEDFEGVSLPSSVKNAAYYCSEEDPINDGNYWHYNADNEIEIWEMI